MTIRQYRDIVGQGEINSLEELEKGLIEEAERIPEREYDETEESGSMGMVLLCTFVAVFGSFEFGSCVSTLNFSSSKNFILAHILYCLLVILLRVENGISGSSLKKCPWFTKWIFLSFFSSFCFG